MARDGWGSPQLTLPEGVLLPNTALTIDKEIRALAKPKGHGARLSRYFADVDQAILYGRHALQAAYLHAQFAMERRKTSPRHDDWEETRALAEEARSSLRRLLLHLTPDDPRSRNIDCLAHLLLPKVHHADLDLVAMAGLKKARLEATALLDAMHVLDTLPAYAGHQRDRLAPLRKNQGEPEKEAFLSKLGEAWWFLTGKVPGSNPNAAQNPFLRFVASAWQDVGGDDEDFAQALRNALAGNHDLQSLREPPVLPSFIGMTNPTG